MKLPVKALIRASLSEKSALITSTPSASRVAKYASFLASDGAADADRTPSLEKFFFFEMSSAWTTLPNMPDAPITSTLAKDDITTRDVELRGEMKRWDG